MAEDDLRIEFHLTENGWVRGTEKFFSNIKGKKIRRPVDAVESCELHIYQRSFHSEEDRKWSSKWKSSKITGEDLKALHRKYLRPDENYKS